MTTTKIKFRIGAIVCFLLFNVGILVGQPTGKKVLEELKGSSKHTVVLISETANIEKEYLEKARKNIEQYRKGDASLVFVDAGGVPINNIQVEINQVSQDFLFGNLVFEIGGFAPKEPYKVDEFKARFKALYNFAVIPFYWNGYEKLAGNPEWQKNQAAMEWCLANGITCKGHPLADWVKYAASKNKPFFISEIGNMDLGFGADHPGPKTFKAALSNASDIALGMNLGVDGFNRWSFTNRGDMDAQWQLVKTYDIPSKTYLKNIPPENEAYYGFAMITRFMGKYASVLATKTDQKLDGVVITSYKNRDGNLSVLMVNNGKEHVTIDISMLNVTKKQALSFYQVTESLVKSPDFKLNPQKVYKNLAMLKNMILLPESISILTTNNLTQESSGIIE